MKVRRSRIFTADFETTVYEGQEITQVWAAAMAELNTEAVTIHHSIDEWYESLLEMPDHLIIYFHNLKFDGSFIIDYLLNKRKYNQAIEYRGNDQTQAEFQPHKDMDWHTFKYSISDMGQWYGITIKESKNKIIEIRDSLKLLPFSVARIGKAFHTKHQKLTMEYEGFRYPGCEITPEEQEYIQNDVLVMKEALEIMYEEGHNRLTIGSCCLYEYKKTVGKKYDEYFPNLYDFSLPDSFGAPNAGEYIRRSYHGGWCYLAKGKEQKVYHGGTTADVNSLYPSCMHSSSGNRYPVGKPTFWSGDYIPDEALQANRYYFIRIRTKFYLKPNKLPTIQIKNTLSYIGTEYLETSDIYNPEDGNYYDKYIGFDGQVHDANVILTLTMTDFKLIKDQYNLVETEILDGCWFESAIGIFDEYIDKYAAIKKTSKGAKRELAKLFLNNLYGKMASSTNSSFKVAYVKPDGVIGFYTVTANDKAPGYIPVGSSITSYARNFTIRAAQENYHGPDKPGFIYADTDSIHCDLPPEKIKAIKVDPVEFNCWKLEACWDEGWYVRQKTYIEHITVEDLEPVNPYYQIKCAGMPDQCKQLLIRNFKGETESERETEQAFLATPRTITDFVPGILIPGKLLPKRIRGGVILKETTFKMR